MIQKFSLTEIKKYLTFNCFNMLPVKIVILHGIYKFLKVLLLLALDLAVLPKLLREQEIPVLQTEDVPQHQQGQLESSGVEVEVSVSQLGLVRGEDGHDVGGLPHQMS